MPMTVVVTRNVPGRYRGFLASCMCEVAPGIYTAPRMTKGVRERVWNVMVDWFEGGEEKSVLMTWPDGRLPGGQRVRALGIPRNDLVRLDGIYLARRDVAEETITRLEEQLRDGKPELVVVAGESSSTSSPS